MNSKSVTIDEFVKRKNSNKLLFTAGPASLLAENITGLSPCFGRGDLDYDAMEERVMNALHKMTGHTIVARMQGAASMALEIMALNFLYGRVLIVNTGYYSQRLHKLAESAKRRIGQIKQIDVVNWEEIEKIDKKFDWIYACYTETSTGLRIPIEKLRTLADRSFAKLMLDATASVGLESKHDLADVVGYSSCKGLFGLTGAAFVACHEKPTVEVDSFYLNMFNHINKMMTGPYHAIASLDDVLSNHSDFREAVVINKKLFSRRFEAYLSRPKEYQPLLCTQVNGKIKCNDERAILYKPRSEEAGSVVCHIGEVHLGKASEGIILSALEIEI